MNKTEMKKVLARHERWLKAYTKPTSKAEDKNKCDVRAVDWEGAQLGQAVLAHADIINSNLAGAYLVYANLTEAFLVGTDFTKADLDYAFLDSADACRANFTDADLGGAVLHKATIYLAKFVRANLKKADLTYTDLRWTDFTNADLRKANLREADLSEAVLVNADLRGADLRGTNLSRADLTGAKLDRADLGGANLANAKFSGENRFRAGVVLTKPMTGYKKTKEGVILTAEIPAGAVVFCVNGGKCRTNTARIVSTGHMKELHSMYDDSVAYHKGDVIVIEDFDLSNSAECANGFHFFKTCREAEKFSMKA